jgi:hypothetical protein
LLVIFDNLNLICSFPAARFVVLSELAVFSTSHVAIGRPCLFTQQFVNRAPLLFDVAN